jgi:polar amino acid transport system substrate-binding protein
VRTIVVIVGLVSMLGAACGGTAASGSSTSSSPNPAAVARADLAPTGQLRLGFPAAPPFLGQQDPGSGQWKGVAISLGNALAASLGVTLAPVQYPDPGAAYQAVESGKVDIVLAPIQGKPDRTTSSQAVLSLEHTYLVTSHSSLQSVSDVDVQGIRVGSAEGSPHTAFLASNLKHAQLIPFPTDADAVAALAAGHIDAYANVRFALAGLMGKVPGSRMLNGTFLSAGFGFVISSQHAKGSAYLNSFVASELSGGQLEQQIQALGKPGVLAGAA